MKAPSQASSSIADKPAQITAGTVPIKSKHALVLNRLVEMRRSPYYASAREELEAAEQVIRAQETEILDLMASLIDATDWIEQRAATEKDGLLVEKLQSSVAKATLA